MKFTDGWHFPDGETHLPQWMATPKARMILNGRPAYQGKKQLAALAECARRGRNRVAVDVGAHIGLWTYNLAPAFEQVIAFEPVEAHRACFTKNMDGTKHQGRVLLMANALGVEEGRISIKTAPTSSGDSWVSGPGEIPMFPLDEFELVDVDFIKIDCEGYEENVLRGAVETIDRNRPIIMVEQKRDMASERFGLAKLGAVNFLLERGYKVAAELSGDYLMVPD